MGQPWLQSTRGEGYGAAPWQLCVCVWERERERDEKEKMKEEGK